VKQLDHLINSMFIITYCRCWPFVWCRWFVHWQFSFSKLFSDVCIRRSTW